MISGSEAPIDFSGMEETVLLKNTIAKDRISIAPKSRKTRAQSRKKKDVSKHLIVTVFTVTSDIFNCQFLALSRYGHLKISINFNLRKM